MITREEFSNIFKTMVVYASTPMRPEYVVAPSPANQQQGTKPLDTLPSQWWNWFLQEATKRFNGDANLIGNMVSEIENLLALCNITPDPDSVTQLRDMFDNQYRDLIMGDVEPRIKEVEDNIQQNIVPQIDAINAVIPMQTSATNQLADKNFVAQKISEIVADSPAAFDTLKEIADWIESHSDSAAAMNSQINENKTNISTLTTKTSQINENKTNISTLTTKTSKLSADGATYSGNAASAMKLKTARNINGVPFDGTKDITLVVSANATHFGTCSNAASTQVKSVSIAGFALVAGARVSVLFSKGNTAGSLSGNSITQASAPMLNVQSTGAKPIKVGNAYAGPNFVNAGEVHDFVYDGSAWNDVTASVIFKGSNSNGNYVKHRDGLIEQWIESTTTNQAGFYKWIYPISFSSAPNIQNSAGHAGDANHSSVKDITNSSASVGYDGRFFSVFARGY